MAGNNRQDDIRAEQAYVDWAYEQIDHMLDKADRLAGGANDAATYRALTQMGNRRHEALRHPREHPKGLVIGRMDLIDHDLPTAYIGREHVDGDDEMPAVIDFRADIATRFYQAGHSDPLGVGRRRTFKMSRKTVEQLDDELLIRGFVPPKPRLDVASPPTTTPPSPVPPPTVAPAPAPPKPEVVQPAPPAPSKPTRVPPWRRKRVKQTETAPPKAPPPPASDPQPPTPQPVPPPIHAPARDLEDGFQPLVGESPRLARPTDGEVFEIRARDLLLEELEASRTGEMHDVVATIQADQDRLMRADPKAPLVIQGGPGTGKTVVGLHRAAWVLYEQRRELGEESVLIIGPNSRFLDYIGAVLPSLGESKATQTTLEGLAHSVLSDAQRKRIEIETVDRPLAYRVKGRSRMATIIANAIWGQAVVEPIKVTAGRFTLALDSEVVQSLIQRLRETSSSYRHAQSRVADVLTARLTDEAKRRIVIREGRDARTDELISIRDAVTLAVQDQGLGRRVLPAIEPRRLIERLLTERAFLDASAEGLLETEELEALLPPGTERKHHWTSADLPLIDEAAAQTRETTHNFSHVVVDEAQDLSPMQWRMVKRRVRGASLTIVGDLAQRTSPWAPEDWGSVLQYLGFADRAKIAELGLGYRITKPVCEFACRLLPEIAPTIAAPTSLRQGDPVRVVTIGSLPETITHLDELVAQSQGSAAVIAPPAVTGQLAALLPEALVAKVSVLTPVEAKGLEYDNVIVVEPKVIAGDSVNGLRQLFIAMTRATHRLVVLTTAGLPPELDPPATCQCGLALQSIWRHCPVCGSAYEAATADVPARYRLTAAGLRCRRHRRSGCPECGPPPGYQPAGTDWQPVRQPLR